MASAQSEQQREVADVGARGAGLDEIAEAGEGVVAGVGFEGARGIETERA